jgi:DNA-directed RNA polymerase specialized sigma24 family protein
MLNNALIYFYESETIKNMFLKIKSHHREDFKSFIMDNLLDKPDKLIKAYEEGWFDFYIWRIIANQYYSTTSPWYRKYLIKENVMIDVAEGEPEVSIDEESVLNQIKSILNRQHWYNRTLFEMYYFEKLTYKKIEEKTGINYISVRRTVMKTLENVKTQIKYDKN